MLAHYQNVATFAENFGRREFASAVRDDVILTSKVYIKDYDY